MTTDLTVAVINRAQDFSQQTTVLKEILHKVSTYRHIIYKVLNDLDQSLIPAK